MAKGINNGNNRLSKKIVLVSKIYDTGIQTDDEIARLVQTDLDNYIGLDKVIFGITTTDKTITAVFQRYTDYSKDDLADGLMKDADAFMITGEGYNNFHLPNSFPIVPFSYSCLMEQKEFKAAYKSSAVLLGANKVNWMKLEIKPYCVVMRLR